MEKMGMTIDDAIETIEYLKTQNSQLKSLDIAITIMRKYQKIEEIVGNYGFYTSWLCLKEIREVLEDGDDD